jgi:hypothetical protein
VDGARAAAIVTVDGGETSIASLVPIARIAARPWMPSRAGPPAPC